MAVPYLNTFHFFKHFVCLLVLLWAGPALAQKPLSYLPTKLANDNLIADLMQIKVDDFKKVLGQPKKYEIQIIYTQVNHSENG